MKTLISQYWVHYSKPQFSPYGGWDDLRLRRRLGPLWNAVENLGKFNIDLVENKKLSKRKKEPVQIGYELFQYMGGSSHIREKSEDGTYESHLREEQVNHNNDSHWLITCLDMRVNSPSLSSSVVSDDIVFDSRELRTQLARSDPLSAEKWIRMHDKISSKDEIASVLINVCEECEGTSCGSRQKILELKRLLMLTNMFLAAIDKFDAMMSKGNVYAPDALFRWGVALQQRSRLRPSNGKEKVKLLQQAKRLYEDALHMDSNNVQVREALSLCTSELSSTHRYFLTKAYC
ncbi:hypothetical protein L3X38_021283 [Prunus dulcis]|uniref:Tetratricopeptide repeat-like superfamily protein n=1 Tax=Prunus dulcis TaxID=3755 RepID=A0AAD4VWI5_PRUDU|nr:hypothetical protein L3X38_021283 [Prunus dulcis]